MHLWDRCSAKVSYYSGRPSLKGELEQHEHGQPMLVVKRKAGKVLLSWMPLHNPRSEAVKADEPPHYARYQWVSR